MSESTPDKPRKRQPNVGSIVRAALAAGGVVTIKDGVVTIRPGDGVTITNGRDVDEWNGAKPM
jgi:hypothetical protein